MPSVKRGCGNRVMGGIYIETALSPTGHPLEEFLYDPPIQLDIEALGLSAIGIKIIPDKNHVYHVYDIVGTEFYPNVTDFVEEVRRFGLSRRISKSVDFSLLTERSKIVLLHPRAVIENAQAISWARENPLNKVGTFGTPLQNPVMPCPQVVGIEHCGRGKRHEDLGDRHCSKYWWEDLSTREGDFTEEDMDSVIRTMPSFSYGAYRRPANAEGSHFTGAFLRLPITNLAVIRDPYGETHIDALTSASAAGITVTLEDE